MDILAPTSIKNLRQIKKFLAQKSLDLSEMYQATYSRIRSSDTTTADLARRVILWICYAQRPLHEIELQHAIATELEDEDFDPDGITLGDLLRSSCMGLVICDEKGMCSLFHSTAYEFFRSNPDMSPDASHLLISRTCLTYLSFSGTGRQGACEDLATLETRNSEFRLLDYAAKHVADHVRQVEAALLEEVSSFLHDDTLRQTLMQAFYHHHRDDEELRRITFETLPSGSSPLQVACGRGLLLTAQRMLKEGEDPKAPDAQGWTPLITATSYGCLEVIRLLLSHARTTGKSDISAGKTLCNDDVSDLQDDIVGIDQPDNDGWTPLFWAIIKNQYQAAELLLTAGASVGIPDGAKWTPIDWAAFRADKAFVDLILCFTPGAHLKGPRHEKPLVHHPEEFSPLFLAAAAGDQQSIEAMLKFGFDAPTSTEPDVEKLFKVLKKLDPGSREEKDYLAGGGSSFLPSYIPTDDFFIKLLESAIRLNQRTIVKMLIELGVSLRVIESEARQRTPLHIAACCGHYEICKYLLLKGASPSLLDADGFTPMDLALIIGHPQCTRLFLDISPLHSTLVDRGVAMTSFVFGLEDAGSGSLMSSTPARHEKACDDPQLPRRALSMLDIRTPDTFSVLLGAHSTGVSRDHFGFSDITDILQALLGHGCDLEATSMKWGRDSSVQETALHQACSIVNPELISFLLDNGADVRKRGYFNESPLHRACSHYGTPKKTIEDLVLRGADTNALDCAGRSPLYEACLAASFEAIKYLVASGAEVKACGEYDHHPIHSACRRHITHPTPTIDTTEVIDYIVRLSEPDVLSVECLLPSYGPLAKSPLELAIHAENWEAVQHLQSLGAKIATPGLLSYKLWQCAADVRGESFNRLIGLGASPAGKCSHWYNQTIVAHYVVRHSYRNKAADEDFEENLKALLQAGADINACSYFSWCGASKDVTVLRMIRDRDLDDSFVQALLRHGALEGEELKGE